ncbi:MAG: hypothetical protein AAF570_24315, partial [Bacteroidota bacterium]
IIVPGFTGPLPFLRRKNYRSFSKSKSFIMSTDYSTTMATLPTLSSVVSKTTSINGFSKDVIDGVKTWGEISKSLAAAEDIADVTKFVNTLGRMSAVLGVAGAVMGIVKLFMPSPMSVVLQDLRLISEQIEALSADLQRDTAEIKQRIELAVGQLKIFDHAHNITNAISDWQQFQDVLDGYFKQEKTIAEVQAAWDQIPTLIKGFSIGDDAKSLASGLCDADVVDNESFVDALLAHNVGDIPSMMKFLIYYFNLISAGRSVMLGYWSIHHAIQLEGSLENAMQKFFKEWLNHNAAEPGGPLAYIADTAIPSYTDHFQTALEKLHAKIEAISDPKFIKATTVKYMDKFVQRAANPQYTPGQYPSKVLLEAVKKQFPWFGWVVMLINPGVKDFDTSGNNEWDSALSDDRVMPFEGAVTMSTAIPFSSHQKYEYRIIGYELQGKTYQKTSINENPKLADEWYGS